MKTFTVSGVTNPDISLTVSVHDEDYEKAYELVQGGLYAWLGSENDREKYFPELEKDDDYWYCVGWQEAPEALLQEAGIRYYIL